MATSRLPLNGNLTYKTYLVPGSSGARTYAINDETPYIVIVTMKDTSYGEQRVNHIWYGLISATTPAYCTTMEIYKAPSSSNVSTIDVTSSPGSIIVNSSTGSASYHTIITLPKNT